MSNNKKTKHYCTAREKIFFTKTDVIIICFFFYFSILIIILSYGINREEG